MPAVVAAVNTLPNSAGSNNYIDYTNSDFFNFSQKF